MEKIVTYLWFDNNAEEAINYYLSIFKDGKIDSITRIPSPQGEIFTATFTLFGRQFFALNGGPHFKFTEAISLFVTCEDQAEVDRYWNKLTSDGGSEAACGWCKDKFGLSWQIVPKQMMAMFADKDQEKARRASAAMLKMRKIELKVIEEAFNGK